MKVPDRSPSDFSHSAFKPVLRRREDFSVPLDGHRLLFSRWPALGPPLLRIIGLHGFAQSRLDFELLADRSPSSYEWLSFDLFQTFEAPGPYDLSFWLRAIELADKIDTSSSPSVVLGYSMGGRLLLHFLCQNHSSFRLALVLGAHLGYDEGKEKEARRQLEEEWISRLLGSKLESFFEYWEALPLIRTQASIPSPYRERMRVRKRMSNGAHLAAILGFFGTSRMPHLKGSLHATQQRCLFAAGERDPKYLQLGQQVSAEHSHIEFAAVPGAGHCAHLENPTATLQLIGNRVC